MTNASTTLFERADLDREPYWATNDRLIVYLNDGTQIHYRINSDLIVIVKSSNVAV